MLTKCKFDPKKDVCEVVPNLALDISKALETGVVVDTGTLPEYNDIDDPASVVCRVRDAFDAMELRAKYLESGRKQEVSNP